MAPKSRDSTPVAKPDDRIHHYRILEKLGSGGMGVVYKAWDEGLQRSAALKFLPSDLADDRERRERLERFDREARSLAKLDHPNIVHVYAVDTHEGVDFIAMEMVEGESLDKKIPKDGLPIDRFLRLAIPLAGALAEAHKKGVIHRDLKPANIMVDGNGQPKILDFGLAKLRQPETQKDTETRPTETMTREGRVLGTYPYMSPEQLQAKKSVDHRTDLFSFGSVLYEMITGKRPFSADTPESAASAILHDPPANPSRLRKGLPRAVARSILRCLEKRPEDRYQSADDLKEDLEETRRRHEKRWPRRLAVAATALALAVPVLWGLRAWVGPLVSGSERSALEIRDLEASQLVEQAGLYEQKGYTRGNLANAEQLYRGALEREPESPWIRAKLAAVLAQTQRTYPDAERRDEVAKLVDQVLAEPVELSPAWVARGTLLLLAGEAQDAESAARRAIAADPEDFEGHTLLGESLIAQDRVDEGLAELRAGAEAGTGYVWAREVLGLALIQLGRWTEAQAVVKKVLELAPDSPAALTNLGAIYLYQGRDADAIPILHRLLALQPDHEVALQNLGTAYFNLGRFEESIDSFRRAYESAPEKPENLQYVGEAYEKLGDGEAAREWFEKALAGYDAVLEAGGKRAMGLGQRAVCSAKLGRHSDAVRDIDAALELAPADTELVYLAAQVFALGGNDERLLEFTRRALAAGHSRDWFHSDTAFETYRDDPEFRALLEFVEDPAP